MNYYYLHEKWSDYQRFGLNDPSSDKEEGLNINDVIQNQHRRLLAEVESLRDNESERITIENSVNQLLAIQGKNDVNDSDEYYTTLKKSIEEKIGLSVDQSLGASEKTIADNASIGAKKNEEDQSLAKMLKPKDYADGSVGIGEKTLNDAIQRLESAAKKLGNSINTSNAFNFKKEFDIVKKYLNKINSFEIKEFKNLGTKSYILPEESDGITREEFTKALVSAYSRLTYGSLASKVGDIAEYFGAAAAARVLLKENEVTQEIEKMLTNDKSGMIKVTGKERTQAAFKSSLGETYTQGKLDQDGNSFYTLKATQDKVDFKIVIDDKTGESLNFSVKNYKNPSTIHLLKGNIYPILEENMVFLYHFLNMITAFKDGGRPNENDINAIYDEAKRMVGIRALIGGRLIKQDNQLIHSDTADYLLVVNNSKKNNPASLYSTKTLGQNIIKSINFIEIKPEFNTPLRSPDMTNESSRFSNIEVSLHLSQLKASMRT